jgi:hypothetical protein
MSFLVHPDYVMKAREMSIFQELLAHLASLRKKTGVWITTPGEVNRWWRQRAEMRLVEDGEGVRIEGAGKERARLAYASEQNGRLIFTFQPPADRASLHSSRQGLHLTSAADDVGEFFGERQIEYHTNEPRGM